MEGRQIAVVLVHFGYGNAHRSSVQAFVQHDQKLIFPAHQTVTVEAGITCLVVFMPNIAGL
jgi:hypothetical protein